MKFVWEFPFWMRGFRRATQIIRPRDIGTALALSGASREGTAVEIGTGSGFATALLSRHFSKVITWERREKHLRTAQENLQRVGLSAEFRLGEPEELPPSEFLLLDIPEAQGLLSLAEESLRPGGTGVAYFPNVHQAAEFARAASPRFKEVILLKTSLEKWEFSQRSLRPEFVQLHHTGFMVLFRKE